jgi:hypothetical protein
VNEKNNTHRPCVSKVANIGGVLLLEMFHQSTNFDIKDFERLRDDIKELKKEKKKLEEK